MGFPFLEVDHLHLRNRTDLQERRETFELLKPIDEIRNELDCSTFANSQSKTFVKDVEWRAGHLRQSSGYWDMVASDLPAQLSEAMALFGDGPIGVGAVRPRKRDLDPCMIAKHPQYRDALLVRSTFRCFHRSDGKAMITQAK